MTRKFVLRVKYGTGSINMLTETTDLIEALKEFQEKHRKALPDTKMYGLPVIIKAEILQLAYSEDN